MGTNTKIDWCDATWSPVTGCLHGCEYCYARKIAYRFGSIGFESNTSLLSPQIKSTGSNIFTATADCHKGDGLC